MLNKIKTIFKSIGLFLIVLFGIISCEKDFEDIAIDLIDNKAFSVGDSIIEIISYSVNIDTSRVDNNDLNKQPLYLLGVNQDLKFGHMKSAILSQVFLPIFGADFGDNAIIDLVVVDIPYFATRDTVQNAVDPITGDDILDDEGNPIITPSFSLDSIYGNKSQEFNITINELGTFLNVLDPENPTKTKVYLSDKDYQIRDQLFSGDFIPNRNDTVLYVERKYLDGDHNTVDDIDTVKAENSGPSMKFLLDKEFFKNRFIDHQNSSDFLSNDNFIQYFRGLYIDANGFDGALMNVAASNAKMTIFYTNDEIRDEGDDEDLNNNGINGELDVLVKTKHDLIFNFGGVRTGKYIRDNAGSEVYNALINPDKDNGEEKLYVQGAAGSEIIIDLFSEESLEVLRNQNWYINEANITIYIDGDQSEVPQRLFLYNYDDNSTLNDFKFENPDVFGGFLEYDDDGNPERYKFRITSYITNILDSENPTIPSKLAIKNYQSTDLPTLVLLDTIIKNYNWIPKGVILKGNLPKEDNDKRIKLEVFYSKVNEE